MSHNASTTPLSVLSPFHSAEATEAVEAAAAVAAATSAATTASVVATIDSQNGEQEQQHQPRDAGIVGYAGEEGEDDDNDGDDDDDEDDEDVVMDGNNDAGGSSDIAAAATATSASTMEDKRKRLCRFPGCNKVIKSQGHCQRHGAKTKRCRFNGCDKQAQGTHDGMCKRHWKAIHFPDAADNEDRKNDLQPPAPIGESVYDVILPLSIQFRPTSSSSSTTSSGNGGTAINHKYNAMDGEEIKGGPSGTSLPDTNGVMNADDTLLLEAMADDDEPFRMDASGNGTTGTTHGNVVEANAAVFAHGVASISVKASKKAAVAAKHDPWDVPPPPEGVVVMPLVQFLFDNAHKKAGWHRHQERRARGVFPVSSLSCQLEPWERQLALVEILLLSGGTPHANFKHLAHAWGREKGFHTVLANSVCERRGEVERKRRSDAGKVMTPEERLAFREKLKRSRVVTAMAAPPLPPVPVPPAGTGAGAATTTNAQDTESMGTFVNQVSAAAVAAGGRILADGTGMQQDGTHHNASLFMATDSATCMRCDDKANVAV